MDADSAYSADRSLKGKLRRRLTRRMYRRPLAAAPDRPMISFTFDDAPATATRAGAEILERHGVRGTYYVSAGLTGQPSFVGPCATGEDYRRVAQAGHEIACHTYSHLDCGKASGQAALDDIARNREALAAWATAPLTTFAYPYGDVGWNAKRSLAGAYSLLRGLHHGLIEQGVDLNQAPAVGIETAEGPAIARRWMARALARKAWLILYTHDVAETPSAWGCTPQALESLVREALAQGFDVVTAAEGVRRLGG